jgi:protein TonB
MEAPQAITTTVAAPAESEPVSAPAPARGAADGGALPSAVSPGVSPGAAATGGQEAGAGAGSPAAPAVHGVPEAVTGSALPGAAGRVGPSAQEIASLRRRIDSRKVYPQIAVRNGWEGRVLVEMHLEVDGRLAAVRLVAGSGYSILDEATITAVRLASPFPPIARVVTVPVEYRLIP